MTATSLFTENCFHVNPSLCFANACFTIFVLINDPFSV